MEKNCSLMDKFLKTFNKEYDKLYNDPEYEDQYVDLIDKFDRLLSKDKTFKLLVNIICQYRQDFITSDREAMAFMLTLRKFKL